MVRGVLFTFTRLGWFSGVDRVEGFGLARLTFGFEGFGNLQVAVIFMERVVAVLSAPIPVGIRRFRALGVCCLSCVAVKTQTRQHPACQAKFHKLGFFFSAFLHG